MSDKKKIICRCEDISLETITETAEQFHCSPREIKLRTRAGMGYCGGKICRTMVERIVQEINNEKAEDESHLSYRPPIRPVTFGQLGSEDKNES